MPTARIADPYGSSPPAPEDADHVALRLGAMSLEDTPFPHALVRDFLPDRLFAALRATFPVSVDSLYSVKQRRGGDQYSDSRFSYTLPMPFDHNATTLAEPIVRLQRLLCSERIVAGLLRAFAGTVNPSLARQYKRTAQPHIGIGMAVELIYDRSGFELVPHTDGARKLVTGLLYVADPDDPATLGTQLYAPRQPGMISNGQAPVAKDLLQPVTRAPYEPNLFLCFGRSDQSFHGVEATTSDRPRRLVQYSIFLA